MSLSSIKAILVSKFPTNLVDELLGCYQEQKTNFFLGNHRPSEVEGGRFSEAAFRLLENAAGFTMTPIGVSLATDPLILRLSQLPSATNSDSVRLHIPRTLRVVYDIRNKRDAAHLADGIDPNLQDASFVFASLDWILAEFIRVAGGVSPADANKLIKEITVSAIPAVENFDGFLKTLRPKLSASERVLLLLYHQSTNGATLEELISWVKPSQRANLRRTVWQLEHNKDFIVEQKPKFLITRAGILEVQKKRLVEM